MHPITPSDLCWIWSDDDPDAGAQVAQLRLEFTASGTASWTGFADTFYTLFCNGAVVGAGPVTGIHTMPRLTSWDLTPWLREGKNVLAIEVWFEARTPGPTDCDCWQAGVLGWLESAGEVIPTGPRWRARRSGHFTLAREEQRGFAAKRVVIADLRGEPDGWKEADFDDAAWPPATVVARHPAPERGTLRMSLTPPFTQQPRVPQSLIDAGIARAGSAAALAVVEMADDVARRMIAQEQQSLIRPLSHMSVLTTAEREGLAFGLPSAEKMAALGWPDLTEAFRCPLSIPAVDGDFYLTLDMGLQTSGRLRLEVETTQETAIDAGYADHLQRGRVNPTLQAHAFADRFLLGPGRHSVQLPHDRGFRYLQLSFSQPVLLHDVHVDEHVYPHDDICRFRSSDETLNRIWEMARATLHQCSLHVHVDNARRERQGWSGPDLYAQVHGFFHAFADLRLTRKMLEDYLDFYDVHGFIPDWYPAVAPAVRWLPAHDLWFPLTCRDYLLYADDRELAPRLLAACTTVLEYYGGVKVDGLLAREHEGACRWQEWNMNAAQQCSTWENLLTAAGWRAIADMRQALHLPGAAAAQREAEALVVAINAHLWHPRHQALAQGTLDDGSLLDFCGQVDNAFALRHDLLLPERRAAAYRFCAGASGTWPTSRSGWQGCGQGERARYDSRKPVVSGTPFSSSLCSQVIAREASCDEAMQYIRYNFGAMLDEGEGTLWEMWPIYQDEEVGATCFSQGYGSHITATLISEILGLTFAAPGGTHLRWQPRRCRLPWAEGQVETRLGAAWVRWDEDGLHYTLPAGVRMTIDDGGESVEV